MDFLKKLDLYPEIVCFNIKSNQKHSTRIGGILGILLILIFIALFLIFGYDCYNRVNPKIVQQNLSSSKIQEFKLKPGDFNVSFTFYMLSEEKGLRKIPARYFDIFFNYTNQSATFPDENFYKSYSADNSTCIFDLRKEMTYYDFVTSDFLNYSFISFNIHICNQQNFAKCTVETINANTLTSEIFVSVSVYSSGIDISNVENPLISVKKDYFIKLNTYVVKNMYFIFKKVEAKNDLGWLFSVPQTKSGLDIESFLDDLNSINDFSGFGSIIFKGFLIFGRNRDFYSISYTKIQDVIAQVGGLVNVFNIIFKIIGNLYSQNEIDNYLVNSLINDNLKEKKKKSLVKLDSLNYQKEILELPNLNGKKQLSQKIDPEMTFYEKIKASLCYSKLNKFELEKFIKYTDCLEKTYQCLDICEYFEMRKKINYLEIIQDTKFPQNMLIHEDQIVNKDHPDIVEDKNSEKK